MELINKGVSIKTLRDRKIIAHAVTDVPGGLVLDMTGYNGAQLYAGQPVYIEDVDGKENYKPLNIATDETDGKQGTFEAIPEGVEFVGVITQSKRNDEPNVGITRSGQVNKYACYIEITKEIEEALGLIDFNGIKR